MNRKHENRLTMYEGLLVLLQTNSAKTHSVGAIADTVSELAALVSAIKSKSVEVDIATVGKAAAKYDAHDALIKALLPACAVLYVLGRKQNNTEIQGRANIGGAKFHNMRDTELSSFATAMADLVTANAPALAPLGLSAEKIADLKAKVDTYTAASGAREVSVTERKGARGTMNDLFNKTDELLREELDRYMELLRPTETELYNKYFSARIVKDLGIRHRTPVEATAAP
jgi:BMFP domain-containing protein YqiC